MIQPIHVFHLNCTIVLRCMSTCRILLDQENSTVSTQSLIWTGECIKKAMPLLFKIIREIHFRLWNFTRSFKVGLKLSIWFCDFFSARYFSKKCRRMEVSRSENLRITSCPESFFAGIFSKIFEMRANWIFSLGGGLLDGAGWHVSASTVTLNWWRRLLCWNLTYSEQHSNIFFWEPDFRYFARSHKIESPLRQDGERCVRSLRKSEYPHCRNRRAALRRKDFLLFFYIKEFKKEIYHHFSSPKKGSVAHYSDLMDCRWTVEAGTTAKNKMFNSLNISFDRFGKSNHASNWFHPFSIIALTLLDLEPNAGW